MVRTRIDCPSWRLGVLLASLALLMPACGGASGGVGPDGAGQGLILVSFSQSNIGNVYLNENLVFTFSEALDPDSISPASVQIRRGPDFGLSVPGKLKVSGSVLTFEPVLPTTCDYTGSGFKADTDYRVSLLGGAEGPRILNAVGQPLESTTVRSFHTRDFDLFRDGVPGEAPVVRSMTPADGDAQVEVKQGNQIVVEFSENIDPCTITPSSVQLHMVEVGHVDEGFIPVEDSSPDPMTWGATNAILTISPPQSLPATVVFEQTYALTQLTITPDFGEFAENALLVLSLSYEIQDFGGTPLAPVAYSFTTANVPLRTGTRLLEYDETTPIDTSATTAEVNTPRAPGRAQGYLLFSGDGDNGENSFIPSRPNTSASGCSTPLQENNGEPNEFAPTSDVILNTGDTVNTCPNKVDGSTAVVWEFKSFLIPDGVTVRVIGRNPAIFLVQDEIHIEAGGVLLARGDGNYGSPRGMGGNGTATSLVGTSGGEGVAGGGDGGDGPAPTGVASGSGRYGDDGVQGHCANSDGSTASSVGAAPGVGGGESNTSAFWITQTTCNRNVPAGGGGGHATGGGSGSALGSGATPVQLDLTLRGGGGGTYPSGNRMLHAEAGSGGGAGGELRSGYGTPAVGPGGAGGAGGGFIDLTCGGNIIIEGLIDASGSPGGNGAGNPFNPNYTHNPGTGGGGGGSGGGIRLISARDIIFGAETELTAAGGAGGSGGSNQGIIAQPVNNGGHGGVGRIVLEDGNSTVTNISSAKLTPAFNTTGFYLGPFDPSRFAGGGLETVALTEPIFAGPIPVGVTSPAFLEPVADDFVAGIPTAASRGPSATGILVEARGWRMTGDGEVDVDAGPSTWSTVGAFIDSGSPTTPGWRPAATYGIPGDITLWADNPGTDIGMAPLSGYAFVQIRLTFYMPSSASPLTAGAYVDRFEIQFTYDQ